MERIDILITGGTFDKEYNELNGELFFRKTHVPEMLRLGRCRLDVRVRSLMMVDSLNMAAAERRRVLAACRSGARRIVVTHGTDTMVDTARLLGRAAAKGALQGKTLVLTGAMVPYKFGSSDGLFNLGSALAFVQSLTPGVYITMNGRCFPWNDTRKNKSKGEFEPLRRSPKS